MLFYHNSQPSGGSSQASRSDWTRSLDGLSPPDGCGETRIPMSNDTPSVEREPAEQPRTRRARTEPMAVSLLRTGGRYEVRVASGRVYAVDMRLPACTCSDWYYREPDGGCKHLRRVDLEIKAGCIAGPTGELPQRPDGSIHDVERQTPLITGPHTEYGPRGTPTGSVYFRCSQCGLEARHRADVHRSTDCQ